MRRFGAIACVVAVLASGCSSGAQCTPGTMRSCSATTEGGVVQSGYQTCDSDRQWSACIPTGACVGPSGAPLPTYVRCAQASDCGPSGCAVCSGYDGVQNPNAFSVCYPYCQSDADCTPTASSSNVTPRCILGQCALLCHTNSTCPADSQCLPWSDPATGMQGAYMGYDGLCD